MSDQLADLQAWVEHLCREFGLDLEVDVSDLLDLAGVAAHTVARPAAPITTFLVGYAAALRGGGPAEVRTLGTEARALAQAYAAATPPPGE